MGDPAVLQLISDTDRRGAQVASIQLGAALRSAGTSVRTVALDHGRTSPPIDVPVIGPLTRPRGLRAVRAAARSVDVVLSQGSTALWGGVAATAGGDRPFVYRSIGDVSVWAPSGLRRARVRWALGRAARVVALWQAAADRLRDHFGVDADRVTVIPQAADSERYAPADADGRAAARHALGLPADAPVVLYLGALSAEKRVDAAIDAVASRPELHLLVVGSGPLEGALRGRASALAGRARFTGTVADPRPALAASDVLVLPSRTEGLPGVIIEAGLSGLPVVATAVGGVPSIVTDGVTGILVPGADVGGLAEALDRALASPGLGVNARARCLEHYTLDAVVPAGQTVLRAATTG